MIKGSLIFCDSNICIYRTLSLIEPKILGAEHLEKTSKMIADLTNNNLACKIIVSDIVYSEIQDNEILFECINEFCVNKLGWRTNSFKIQQIFLQAKKSIGKFVTNKLINSEDSENIKSYKKHLSDINKFYLKYPERIEKVTENKTKYLKPFDKQKKLKQRPDNLPEENDRLLICQAIEFKQKTSKNVSIFTNDSDFLEFKSEIKSELGIEIIGIESDLKI